MKSLKPEYFILGLTLIASALISELIVRIIAPQNISSSMRVISKSGISINKSSGEAFHTKAGRKVTYSFHPPFLRDTKLHSDKENVLFLGDSYTFGFLLRHDLTFVNLLQKRLNSVESLKEFNFLNAACPGWGLADVVRFTETESKQVTPAAIVYVMSSDDIGRALRSELYSINDAGDVIVNGYSPSLSEKLKSMLNSIPVYDWLLQNSHLIQLTRLTYLKLAGLRREQSLKQVNQSKNQSTLIPHSRDLNHRIDEGTLLAQALLLRLKLYCEKENIKLIILNNGIHGFVRSDREIEPTLRFFDKAIGQSFFQEFSYLDISPQLVLRTEGDFSKISISNDGHFNELGSQLVSEFSFDFLKNELTSVK